MKDKRIRSWGELMDILYDIPVNQHGRYRSNFVYRGVANKGWGLETSLHRLGDHCGSVEAPLLRNFSKYVEPGAIPATVAAHNLWIRLAVAQHHGLPTRVLDWTVSPKVAAHFATAEVEHFDKDGAIWCIDVVQAARLLPANLRQTLEKQRAFIFSVEMLGFIDTVEQLDVLGKQAPFVLFFEPPSLDARIVNQGAVMSVMSSPVLALNKFLKRHPDLYYRLIIPKRLKWEIRDKLDQDNVTERMLFPGLDGLSRWLKRYYSSKTVPSTQPVTLIAPPSATNRKRPGVRVARRRP